MNIYLTNRDDTTIQLPIVLKQLRYTSYGIAQAIAEIPRYDLYVNSLIQQDNIYILNIFDGLTLERCLVDIVQITEDRVRLVAVGPTALLNFNPLYQRMWHDSRLDSWRDLTNAPNTPVPVALDESVVIRSDKNGLNLDIVGGGAFTSNFTGNGYYFYGDGSILTGIAFDLWFFLESPMRPFLQIYDENLTFISNIFLALPAASPGTSSQDTFHIALPANVAYIAFAIANFASPYSPPFTTGVHFARISNTHIVSSNVSRVNTTVGVAITVTGQQFVTPASMANIVPDMDLQIAAGSSSADRTARGETVRVLRTTATQFEAVFIRTHPIGDRVQGFLVTPDEIVKDVIDTNITSSTVPSDALLIDSAPIAKHAVMIGDENIQPGNTGKAIIDRIIQEYSSDHSFSIRNSQALFAVKDYYNSTYKAIIDASTLSSRLSSVLTGAKTVYKTTEGFNLTTDLITNFPNPSDVTISLLEKYGLLIGTVVSNETTSDAIAIEVAQSALRNKSEIELNLTFDVLALFLDGGISLPLYWLRPNDLLILGGSEFENIQVRVVGWTWDEGGERLKVEASAQEADLIRLLSNI